MPPPTGNLKINLNKRVAFPLSKKPLPATSVASENSPSSSLPPMPPNAMPILSTIQQPTTLLNASDDSSFNSKVELKKVLEILHRISSQSSATTSINAKLKSLDEEWKNYDINLMNLIIELAKCKEIYLYLMLVTRFFIYLDIDENDSKNAAAVQRKIIMGGCNHQWMHGVRQIISILESKNYVDDK